MEGQLCYGEVPFQTLQISRTTPLIPHSRFGARLSEVVAASAALSHEPEHPREDLLSASWVCSMENMSANLIEGFCSGDWEISITCIVSEWGWLKPRRVLVWKKKSRSLKKQQQQRKTLLHRCQVRLWAGAGVWAEELDWLPTTEGGPSCRALALTTAPLLRNRRLISPGLDESIWRTVEKIIKNKWDGGTMEKRQRAVMCSEMAGGRNNAVETNREWLCIWGRASVPLEGHSFNRKVAQRWRNLESLAAMEGDVSVCVCVCVCI